MTSGTNVSTVLAFAHTSNSSSLKSVGACDFRTDQAASVTNAASISSSIVWSIPLSLLTKCKCENSHRNNLEGDSYHGSPLVHRRRARGPHASLRIPRKPGKDVGDMVITGRTEGRVSEPHRFIKQFFMLHAASIGAGRLVDHSYLPRVSMSPLWPGRRTSGISYSTHIHKIFTGDVKNDTRQS